MKSAPDSGSLAVQDRVTAMQVRRDSVVISEEARQLRRGSELYLAQEQAMFRPGLEETLTRERSGIGPVQDSEPGELPPAPPAAAETDPALSPPRDEAPRGEETGPQEPERLAAVPEPPLAPEPAPQPTTPAGDGAYRQLQAYATAAAVPPASMAVNYYA